MLNQKSIAVLPLENLSSDVENEYFSDGMTEEIINALSKIKGLKVTARTSSFAFKNLKKDVRYIGNELGVSMVLEGSIRKSGDNIRITTQLIQTSSGFHIWSENFDRKLSNIFELQDEISLLVAEKIRENYGHLELENHLVDKQTSNIDAYEAFLKGKYFLKKWNLQDIHKGALLYEESAKLDPGFDQPLFGAGLCYGLLGSWGAMDQEQAFEKAEIFFERGAKINAKSVYSYHCLATYEFWGRWDYRAANESIQKALKIYANESDVNECMAEIHTAIGDFTSAHISIDTSLQNNPLSPNHFYSKANIYYHQNEYTAAQACLDKSLEINPDFALSIQLKLACFILQDDLNGLRQMVRSHPSLEYPEVYEMLYHLVHGTGSFQEAKVRTVIDKIQLMVPSSLIAWDMFLMVYIAPEEALELLKQKTSQSVGQVINFKHEKLLNPIRSHSGFDELVNRYFPDDSLNQKEVDNSPTLRSVMTDEEVDYCLEKLSNNMKDAASTYLNPELSLKALAEQIDLHPNKLSWLLNDVLGKNFNDYINGFRLEEFQRRAVLPENKHLTLLGLGFESGFNSKSVFNDFFKKHTGLTPKAWVNANRKRG